MLERVVPFRVLKGGDLELAQFGFQCPANAIDALPCRVGLDVGETADQHGPRGVEHADDENERGETGGNECPAAHETLLRQCNAPFEGGYVTGVTLSENAESAPYA